MEDYKRLAIYWCTKYLWVVDFKPIVNYISRIYLFLIERRANEDFRIAVDSINFTKLTLLVIILGSQIVDTALKKENLRRASLLKH